MQQHVVVTCRNDKSLHVYRRIFVKIFVSVTSHKKSNHTKFVQLVVATKFCCRDKDFRKNLPVHKRWSVSVICYLPPHHCHFLVLFPYISFCGVFTFSPSPITSTVTIIIKSTVEPAISDHPKCKD